MKAQQLLYYSWKGLARAGFGLYAKSAGISQEEESEICGNLAYVAPTAMEPFSSVVTQVMDLLTPESYPESGEYGVKPEIQKMIDDAFPVNYAHFVLSSGRYCYARVAYCGLDYQKSRWANYILHAYVTNEPYSGSPAALFACNPFKTCMSANDMKEQTPPEELPEIELAVKQMGAATVTKTIAGLGAENVARFLLSVIQSTKKELPILINAKSENILRYISLAQMLLPSIFTKDLTFSTYMFNENSDGPYRFKRYLADGYQPFSYASRVDTDVCVVADFENGSFTVAGESLELICELLQHDPTSPEFAEVRDMIEDYYNAYQDYDGKRIARFRALIKGAAAKSSTPDEVLADLQTPFFRLPKYADTVRRITFEALKIERPVLELLPLIEFADAHYPTHRDGILMMLIAGAQKAVATGALSPEKAASILETHCGGRAVAKYLSGIEVHKKEANTAALKMFSFHVLICAYRAGDRQTAESELMLTLHEQSRQNAQQASVLLELLVALPELHGKAFRALFQSAASPALCRELITYGRAVAEKSKAFETGFCKLLLEEKQNKELSAMMQNDAAFSEYVVKLLSANRKSAELGADCSALLWELFEKKAVAFRNKDLLGDLLLCFTADKGKYLAILTQCLREAGEEKTYAWFAASAQSLSDLTSLLSGLHQSELHALGERYLRERTSDEKSYLQYLTNWYGKGLYTESFQALTERMKRNGAFGEQSFLKKVLAELRSPFSQPGHEQEVKSLSDSLKSACFKGLPQTKGWTPLLNEIEAMLKAQGMPIPISFYFVKMAESTDKEEYAPLLTVAKVNSFAGAVGAQNYVNYVNAYLDSFVDALGTFEDREDYAAMLTLITGTGDASIDDDFAKLVLKKKRDKHERICNLLDLYFQYGKEPMEASMIKVLKGLPIPEFMEVVAEMKKRHTSKKLDRIFELAKAKFGFFKRLRLNHMIKKIEKEKEGKKGGKKDSGKKNKKDDDTVKVRHS